MRIRLISLGLIGLFFILVGLFYSNDKVVYQHPTLNILFEAKPGWKQLPRPEDKNTYEIVDPDGLIHVIVWYTTTEQSALKYLKKMASMKDLILSEKDVYEETLINNHQAYVLDVEGFENKKPIQTLLAVIPHGKSKQYPRENYLFLIQIWCPKKVFEQNRALMQEILKSMEIQ